MRDEGAAARALIAEWRKLEGELAASRDAHVQAIGRTFAQGVQAVADCVEFIVASKDPVAPFAGAVPFLKLMGIVAGGWQMARAALAAKKALGEGRGDEAFLRAKLATVRFYADHLLVQAPALRDTVVKGSSGVMALGEDQFFAA